jgi:D-sedoheptulose 7-phosphate isomerase
MRHEHTEKYLREVKEIVDKLDRESIDKAIDLLKEVRDKKGRLFIIGVGGGAGHASHAVNDFRKIGGMEAYTPVDNVSELTARVNDDGWHSIFSNWLLGSHLNDNDAILVFSVGGGHLEKNISPNIVHALKFAKEVGSKIIGIVGRDGGYTKEVADVAILVPVVNPETVTPHTEAFQAIIWHLIVSHPEFKMNEMKWESTK